MPNDNNTNGWKVAFALFGLAQIMGLFLLTMIFSRVDRIEGRVGDHAERQRLTEYRMDKIESGAAELRDQLNKTVRTTQ